MVNVNDSNLMSNTELRDYFQETQEGKVFWGSFEEVFLKNYGRDGEKIILTPVIFKISLDSGIKYAGKMVKLTNEGVQHDVYSNLLESDNLLLLMSYLIKGELQTMFQSIDSNMNFKEIALILGDKQFVVGERVRQILVLLCNELQFVLDKQKNHE